MSATIYTTMTLEQGHPWAAVAVLCVLVALGAFTVIAAVLHKIGLIRYLRDLGHRRH